jgi:hypothetical protein
MLALPPFDPSGFRFHAVETREVKNATQCKYALSRQISCKYTGNDGIKHYHCLQCEYTTISSKNVRQHFDAHNNKAERGKTNRFVSNTIPNLAVLFLQKQQS